MGVEGQFHKNIKIKTKAPLKKARWGHRLDIKRECKLITLRGKCFSDVGGFLGYIDLGRTFALENNCKRKLILPMSAVSYADCILTTGYLKQFLKPVKRRWVSGATDRLKPIYPESFDSSRVHRSAVISGPSKKSLFYDI